MISEEGTPQLTLTDPIGSRAELIVTLLDEIQAAFAANLSGEARSAGCTGTQFLIMRDVAAHPGTGIAGICERLGLVKSSVSRMVEQLVRQGAMNRAIRPENRRAVELTAASDFLKCRLPLQQSIPRLFKGLEAGTDPRQLDDIIVSLRKVAALVKGVRR